MKRSMLPIKELSTCMFCFRPDIIRRAKGKCEGIKINPLSVADLHLQNPRKLIPDPLYWYLPDDSSSRCSNVANQRKILMLGKDIIYGITNARVKSPKQIGLGITIKHLTRWKQLITLLNQMVHCYCNSPLISSFTFLSRPHPTIVPFLFQKQTLGS